MQAWAANIMGGVGAAAILAGGLVVGAPATEANAPARAVSVGAAPSVDGSAEVQIGDGLEVWGQPMQLNLFRTEDDSDTVVRTYRDAWEKADLLVTERREAGMATVSALEESTGLMRTVAVLDGGGQRLVLPSVTDIRKLPDPTPRGAPVPVPSNAKAYLAHAADDVVSVSYNGTFIVPLAPERVLRFYEIELGKAGYEPAPGMKASGRAETADWVRGPERVTVAANVFNRDSPDASFVVVTHVRSLVQEAP